MKKYVSLLMALLVFAAVLTGCGSDKNPVSMGKIENGVYTNTYAGFGCQLDDSWIYSGAQELQELPENLEDHKGFENEVMSSHPQLFDLQAENEALQSGINVVYTKLGAAERTGYKMRDEENEVDMIVEQKEQIIELYKTSGIEIETLEKKQITFLGEEHFVLHYAATWDGKPYYIMQFSNCDAGTYGITLTAFSFEQDHTQEILEMFYKVG